jgi:hypothetical protein
MDIQEITITSEQYEKLENDLHKIIRDSLHRNLFLDDFEYEHVKNGGGQSMLITGRVSHNLADSLKSVLTEWFNESTSGLLSHTIVLQSFVAFVKTLHTSGRWSALYKNRSKLVDTMGTYVENLLGIGTDHSPTLLDDFINVVD